MIFCKLVGARMLVVGSGMRAEETRALLLGSAALVVERCPLLVERVVRAVEEERGGQAVWREAEDVEREVVLGKKMGLDLGSKLGRR